jgi:hypothetical protein
LIRSSARSIALIDQKKPADVAQATPAFLFPAFGK